MALTQLSIEEVNNLPSNHFINIFGNIVERYPTAAIKILKYRPFNKMQDIVDAFYSYLNGLNVAGN